MRLSNLIQSIGVRRFAIAIVLWCVSGLAIYQFVLAPASKLAQTSHVKFDKLKETYLRLKTTDIKKISVALQRDVDFLSNKHHRIFGYLLFYDQIPFFISRLERDAEKVGLKVATVMRGPEMDEQQNIRYLTMQLDFEGTFKQVSAYFIRLQDWPEILLIDDFVIQEANPGSGKLNGHVQFVLLLRAKDSMDMQ